jgi:hypothetical protein
VIGILLAALLAHGEIVWPPHAPRLPVFGPGPVFNVFSGDDAAIANASAHVAWGVMVPVVGERIGGRKGMWWATGIYSGLSVVHLACFHDADGPELRTDIASRIFSSLLTAAIYEGLHALKLVEW